VRLAKENESWGYDRIAGASANLRHEVSDQTVGNILKRQGIPRAPERKKTTTWTEFIRSHMDVLAATDFFTAVWTQGGLVTYYVLFFIHLDTRRVYIAGITPHPFDLTGSASLWEAKPSPFGTRSYAFRSTSCFTGASIGTRAMPSPPPASFG
jgi:hypothetical protein